MTTYIFYRSLTETAKPFVLETQQKEEEDD